MVRELHAARTHAAGAGPGRGVCQNRSPGDSDMRLTDKTLVFFAALLLQAGGGASAVDAGLRETPAFIMAQAAASQLALPKLLERARALATAGKPGEAYELLTAAEDLHIGEIEFDYALGRAALDAGRPDKATLALSRVLALDPAHAGALIDTGRAYLALGNFSQAQTTFEALLAQNPPATVRVRLQEYLAQARARLAARGERVVAVPGKIAHQGYLAALIGHSSNVNQSPAQSQVFVPAFGASFQLASQNTRKADGFSGLLGGLEASVPLHGAFSLVGGGEIFERRNGHEGAFNLGGVGARLGIVAANEQQQLRARTLTSREFLGGSPSRDLNALAIDYTNAVSPTARFIGFAQAGRLRYVPTDLRIFDANLASLGFGASQKFAGESSGFVAISTGRQNDTGGNPSGNQSLFGLRLGGETLLQPRWKLLGSLAREHGRYDRTDPSFLIERNDMRTNLEVVLQYSFQNNLQARFGLTYAVQRSNVPVYEYTRNEWWGMLRYEIP